MTLNGRIFFHDMFATCIIFQLISLKMVIFLFNYVHILTKNGYLSYLWSIKALFLKSVNFFLHRIGFSKHT